MLRPDLRGPRNELCGRIRSYEDSGGAGVGKAGCDDAMVVHTVAINSGENRARGAQARRDGTDAAGAARRPAWTPKSAC